MSDKRGRGRGKVAQYPCDLYALGQRSTASSKPSTSGTSKIAPSVAETSKRRNPVSVAVAAAAANATAPIPSAKYAKIASSLAQSRVVESQASSSVTNAWERLAVDVDPVDLVLSVEEAYDSRDMDKVIGFLLGAMKLLRSAKLKVDPILSSGLMVLAKSIPKAFTQEVVLTTMLSIIKREPGMLVFKNKPSTSTTVLVVNILYIIHNEEKTWPDIIMKVFIEDSITERMWVDLDHCKCLTDNILASVNTKPCPPYDLETGTKLDVSNAPKPEHLVMQRYKECPDTIETVIDVIREQITRRQPTSEAISKHFIKFVTSMCGIPEVRSIVANKLDVWLQNPKLTKSAQELLLSICVNCTTDTQTDKDVISSIIRIRPKTTKPALTFHIFCVKELIPAHKSNLGIILKIITTNEISTSRNSINMQIIGALFQADPEGCAETLAETFLEILVTREDSLKPLRSLLKEISLKRLDLHLSTFCRSLMTQRLPCPIEDNHKTRVFANISDLITFCIFLSISPFVRTEKNAKDQYQLEKLQRSIAKMQADAMVWFHESAVKLYNPNVTDYVHGIRKVVFMEPLDQYHKLDNWPIEQERDTYIRYAIEVPLLQSTVIRIFIIGLSKEHPLPAIDALELAEHLVRRAAGLAFTMSIPPIQADKREIIDLLFNLSIYQKPDNISLPAGYDPPNFAVNNLYWKSWIILLIYCAHVPKIFGALAWEKYPTLKTLIEMCITNNFVYLDESNDLQRVAEERQKILEFESHLAAGSTKHDVNELTSLLLSQLIVLDPLGPPRRPPSLVFDQLRNLNSTYKIGQLLCRSRKPDFLTDIIKKYGSSESLPWLSEIVRNSEDAYNHLPVICLCEYLIANEKKLSPADKSLIYIQEQLFDKNRKSEDVLKIMEYFLSKLTISTSKEQAISALILLLTRRESSMEDDSVGNLDAKRTSWLLYKLPSLPHFNVFRSKINDALRVACLVENDPDLITAYLVFLAKYAITRSENDTSKLSLLAQDLSTLIVERSIIMSAILPSAIDAEPFSNLALHALFKIFHAYLIRVKSEANESYESSPNHDYVIITFNSKEKATMSILVAHAMLILISYGPVTGNSSARYLEMLDIWFPANGDVPKAHLMNKTDEADLIPSWLRLKLIRSKEIRLVKEALKDAVGPADLALYIQSFGVPVSSMSMLLAMLDEAVLSNKFPDFRQQEFIEPKYVIQLIDMQHKREVTGGHIFVKFIKKLYEIEEKEESVTIDLTETDSDTSPIKDVSISLNPVDIDNILDNLGTPLRSDNQMRKKRANLLHTLASEMTNNSKSNSNVTPTVNKILSKLLRKCADKHYALSLLTNYSYPCRLFRMFAGSENKEHCATFSIIAKTLMENHASNATSNPLVALLNDFMTKNNCATTTVAMKNVTAQSPLEKLQNSWVESMEKLGRHYLNSEGSQEKAVENVVNLMNEKGDWHTGLCIDWLVEVEPEMIGSSMSLQMDLLFSANASLKSAKCRPYLLSLLTHHANWVTIEKTVRSLLNLQSISKYDATAVLDFLCAIASNPKLWKGREKLSSKGENAEDILNLSYDELSSVIEYIVLEVKNNGGDYDRMNSRVTSLIESAFKPDSQRELAKIINKLASDSSSCERDGEIYKKLVTLLYVRFPCLLTQFEEEIRGTCLLITCERGSSVFDHMSHNVITSLTTEVEANEWPSRAADLELVLCSMAAAHPTLVMRQLNIINTSLMGRIILEWDVFYERHHYELFKITIGVLDILEEHLFAEEFSKIAHRIFDSYFELINKYGKERKVEPFMERFVMLMQKYVSLYATRALQYLKTQASVLMELQRNHPITSHICILMAGVGEEEVVLTAAPRNNFQPNLDAIVNALRWNNEASCSALDDLERLSFNRAFILEPIVEFIVPFLTDPYNMSHAHNLLSRLLKHNPSTSAQILPAVMNCLHSENSVVVEAACQKLPELVACSQEKAVPILRKLFTLGIRQRVDTVPHIMRAVNLLNLQTI